ncbi:MAG TPA: ABC transporter six-transmembrane domain-containing protein [Geminicoccaceae bacterium]|nr:ABC transporter six-transmembrane domain-containing protein [Geminicoccaceae bacterium]
MSRTSTTTAAVFRAERWRLALTYGVTLLENVFYLLYPWTTGVAIDGLLAGRGPRSLVPLVAVWGLHIVVGAVRQVYDTWVFARIHAEVATGAVARQRAAGVGTTEIAARSVMSRELVDFFEREVPTIATATLGLVGGIAMLFYYDRVVGLIVALLMIPVLAVYAAMGRRAHALNKDLNDETEREVDLIARGRLGPLASHFRRRGRLRVRLSNVEAASWSLVELFSITAVVMVLLRATGLPGVQAGELYAMLAYVWRVLECLDQVPLLVQRLARLLDIRRRLELGRDPLAAG